MRVGDDTLTALDSDSEKFTLPSIKSSYVSHVVQYSPSRPWSMLKIRTLVGPLRVGLGTEPDPADREPPGRSLHACLDIAQ
jgi:hypothetical protein